MRFAGLLLLLPVAAAAQDTETQHTFKPAWQWQEGQRLRMEWTIRGKLELTVDGEANDTRLDFELGGVLHVRSVDEAGTAEATLVLDRVLIRGVHMGREFDIEFRDGELMRPKDDPATERHIRENVLTPLLLTIDRRGGYRPHPDDASRMQSVFTGQGGLFGPRLPEEALSIGGTWTDTTQGPTAARSGGFSFETTRQLQAVEDGVAHIRTRDERTFEQDGMDGTYTVTADGRFSLSEGRLVSWEGRTVSDGKGELQGRAVAMHGEGEILVLVSPVE